MTRGHFIRISTMLGLGGIVGCQKMGAGGDPNVDYYTCTMHPSVRSHDPNGKCPICSMDLGPGNEEGSHLAWPRRKRRPVRW